MEILLNQLRYNTLSFLYLRGEHTTNNYSKVKNYQKNQFQHDGSCKKHLMLQKCDTTTTVYRLISANKKGGHTV